MDHNSDFIEIPGFQELSQDLLLHDMAFLLEYDHVEYIWVLSRLQKTDVEHPEGRFGVLYCPRVLFSLACVFLRYCFRAILERSNIYRSKR